MHEIHTQPGNEATSALKQQVGSVARDVSEKAESAAEAGKEKIAHQVGDFARAVRRAGEHEDQLSSYTDSIGNQLERFAHFIEERDVGQLLGEASRLAHRQPALFIGGAFTVGLLAARFLKSNGHGGWSEDPYSRDLGPGELSARSWRAREYGITDDDLGERTTDPIGQAPPGRGASASGTPL
jgi:hypothetical protein